MGRPSKTASVIDNTPATIAQPPPPWGFENPIPTYPAMTGYNPFDPSTPMGYNYQAPAYDPYAEAIMHNALYPSPFPPCIPNWISNLWVPVSSSTTTTTITTTIIRGLKPDLGMDGRRSTSGGEKREENE
ncbi:hypothetical protein Hanom_Chr07g00645481 [Helianthus anomalus]